MSAEGQIGAWGPNFLTEALGVRRLLVFVAHPDDLDFGAAATVAALTDRGVEVTLCVLTSGDAGGFEPGRDAEQMVAARQAEQRRAAEVLGISEVIFLDERDGFVEPTYRLQRSIVRLMRRVRPDAVLTQHPERAWDRLQKSHPDHLACGEAVVRAAYPAVENPFAFPELLEEEGLEAFRLNHLMFMGSPQHLAGTRINVTGYEQRKLQALLRHLSQHPDPAQMEEFVLQQMRSIFEKAKHQAGGGGPGAADGQQRAEGGAHQLPETGYAEEFHLVAVNAPETIAGF